MVVVVRARAPPESWPFAANAVIGIGVGSARSRASSLGFPAHGRVTLKRGGEADDGEAVEV
ncbi:MAG: hypothetical protein CMJ31_13845 [Phycisphaerae bacterium]|nr:hypothetical protein [Phycisphaerae bacterium]